MLLLSQKRPEASTARILAVQLEDRAWRSQLRGLHNGRPRHGKNMKFFDIYFVFIISSILYTRVFIINIFLNIFSTILYYMNRSLFYISTSRYKFYFYWEMYIVCLEKYTCYFIFILHVLNVFLVLYFCAAKFKNLCAKNWTNLNRTFFPQNVSSFYTSLDVQNSFCFRH